MSSPLRRPLALATVLAAGSLAILGGVGPANASQPSSPSGAGTITSSAGSQIWVPGQPGLSPQFCSASGCDTLGVKDAQWSPDGSRAVFIDPNDNDAIATVGHDDPQSGWYVADGDKDVDRSSPSYRGSGSSVVFAQRDAVENTPPGHWGIKITSSSYAFDIVDVTAEDGHDYTDPDGGPDGRVVFERDGATIVLWDGSGTAATDFTDVIAGTDPAISPDGTKVAYVSGGQIWKADLNGANATAVTTDATSPTNPTWHPSGAGIAFTNGDSKVRTVFADGGSSSEAGLNGVPAYRSQKPDAAVRLSGPSRFDTAAAVSGAYWKTKGVATDSRHTAKSVVLSRSDTFADALGGSTLAAAKEGPLLLTPPSTLDPVTAAEINRVLDPGDTVYLLGSTGAISATVETQVRNLGYTIDRVAGADRFGTAVAIANKISANPDLILVATGMNFPDALGAGAAAGSYNVPNASLLKAVVVLTLDNTLPAATRTYLDTHGGTIYPIGKQGFNATDADYRSRSLPVFGDDRYETAFWVAFVFFGGQHEAGVATGTNWPDALSGGALMGTLNGPLLLTPGTAASTSFWTASNLDEESTSLDTVLVFGSAPVVSNAQLNSFGALISGPGGFTTGTGITFPAAAAKSGLRSATATPAEGLKTLEEIKAAAAAVQNKR